MGMSGNRTVSRGRASPHAVAVSPSQYFKEWQTPKAVPTAYLSVVDQQFTPIQQRQAQQQVQMQVTPAAAPVTRKVRASAQKPAVNAIGQQPAKRRPNMQRAGPLQLNAMPAPAGGNMYAEMQAPSVPVSGLFDTTVPQMLPMPALTDMATAEGMQSRNTAPRLGQAFSFMQGTSPAQGMSTNPAFAQPDAAAVPPPAAQHQQFMMLLQQREQLIQQQQEQQQQRRAQKKQPTPATVAAPAAGSLSGKNTPGPTVEKQTSGNASATAPTQPQQQQQQQAPAKAVLIQQPSTQPPKAGAAPVPEQAVLKPTPTAAAAAPQQQLPLNAAGAGAVMQTPSAQQPALPAVPGSNSSSAGGPSSSTAANSSAPSNASSVASDRNVSSSGLASAIGGALDRPLAAVRKVVRRIVGSDGVEEPSGVSSADEAVRTVASARGKLHVNAS
jgi:hypothetical protein